MQRAALSALVAAAAGATVGCLQIAGVQDVTFTAGDGGQDAVADGPMPDAATEAGGEASPDVFSLPAENCPLCGDSTCCSPHRCMGGSCCSDRAGPCAANTDCCDGQCDVDAGRCTGACLAVGASPCVVNTDCCTGTCNSAGQCEPCGAAGAGCSSDGECCFGLGCTSSDGGVCMAF